MIEEPDLQDDEVSIVTTPFVRIRVLLPTLAALAVAIWLLASRFLNGQMADVLTGLQWMALTFLAPAAFLWSFIFSAVHLLCAPTAARRGAVLPVAINLLAFALYVVPTPLIEQMDYQRHREARAEVVRRIEAGELWNGSPYVSVVSLPRPDYPKSVSNGADQDCVTVYREDGVLNVVFYPVAGSLLDRNRNIIYRSDGKPTTVPNRVLPNALSGEPLEEGWYWLSYSGQEELGYVATALMIVYLTMASGIVALPLGLGVHRLARG